VSALSQPEVFRNYIQGEWVEGRTFENRNPANTGDVMPQSRGPLADARGSVALSAGSGSCRAATGRPLGGERLGALSPETEALPGDLVGVCVPGTPEDVREAAAAAEAALPAWAGLPASAALEFYSDYKTVYLRY